MSIVESLKKLVDPIAAREAAADQERFRQPRREEAGPPRTSECRVCGYLGPEPDFCPSCLAQTMRPTDKTAPPPEPPSLAPPAEGTDDSPKNDQ